MNTQPQSFFDTLEIPSDNENEKQTAIINLGLLIKSIIDKDITIKGLVKILKIKKNFK